MASKENAEASTSKDSTHPKEGTINNALIRYAGTLFSIEKDGRDSIDDIHKYNHGNQIKPGETPDFLRYLRGTKLERERKDLLSWWIDLKANYQSRNIKSIWGQVESAPSTGNLHIQFYAVFERRIRVTTAKKRLEAAGNRHPYLTLCRGTHTQNISYVTKSDSRFEALEPIGDSNYTGADLEAGGKIGKIARLIETSQSKNIRAALKELPVTGLQNIRNLQTFLSLTADRCPKTRINIFLSGPPRCGKTRMAFAIGGDDIYVKPQGKWFDGYMGEKYILFDEINGLDIDFQHLLRITDRYPINVEVKGGSVQLSSRINIFTSNLDFDSAFYRNREIREELRNALYDRFYIRAYLDMPKKPLQFPLISFKKWIIRPTDSLIVAYKSAHIAVRHVDTSDRLTEQELLQCISGSRWFHINILI